MRDTHPATAEKFRVAVVAAVEKLGAIRDTYGAYHINTRSGWLTITPTNLASTVFCRFDTPHLVQGCWVGCTGKWNHHFDNVTVKSIPDCVAEFVEQLRGILPEERAA